MALHHQYWGSVQTDNPTFHLFKGSAFNGVDQLNPSLLINGTTVTPTFRYKGGDADGTDWDAWTHGETLTLQAGTVPSYNQGSPLLGANDDSVLFNDGGYYKAAAASSGDVATEDIVFEVILKISASTQYFNSKYVTIGHAAFTLSNTVRFLIADTGGSAQVASAALTADTWYHCICFVNRNENSTNASQWYINGVASGAGVNISSISGSLSNANFLTVGAKSNGAVQYGSNVAYLAIWKQADWHQAGAAGPAEWSTIAKERFNMLIGIYPQKASGTKIPTIQTRATTAYLDKYNTVTGAREMFLVGPNWLRIVSRVDKDGV